MSAQLNTINFHEEEVSFVQDDKGEVYIPMKERVEALGLQWTSQHRKLKEGSRWGVLMMSTPSAGGCQGMVCLPLRKLDAWIMSIDANRVKPELRERLELYQNELSEVLWAYRSKGIAVNPRAHHLPGYPIGVEGTPVAMSTFKNTLAILGTLEGIPATVDRIMRFCDGVLPFIGEMDETMEKVENIRKHSAGSYRNTKEMGEQLSLLTRTVTQLVELEKSRMQQATPRPPNARESGGIKDGEEETLYAAKGYMRNDDASRRLGILPSMCWATCRTYHLPTHKSRLGFKMVHWDSVQKFFLKQNFQLEDGIGPLFADTKIS